jgi:hypothetical protein
MTEMIAYMVAQSEAKGQGQKPRAKAKGQKPKGFASPDVPKN